MKKFTSIIIAAFMVLSLAGCSGNTSSTGGTITSEAPSSAPAESTVTAEAPNTADAESKPETSQPESSTQESGKPETSEPEADTAETSAPETTEPTTNEPAINATETSQPETSTPETTPATTTSTAATPETTKPETAKPEITKPETTKPETTKPATTKPTTTKPATTKPTTTKSATTKPTTTKSETTKPETTKAETTKPETSIPETTTSAPETEEPAEITIASPSEVINSAWALFSEDEKFPVAGGDFSSGELYEEAAPFSLDNPAELDRLTGFPAAEISKIDSAASMIHMLNTNTFSAGAFHVTAGTDMDALCQSIKDNVLSRRWMCGFPDKVIVAKVGDYIVCAYGLNETVDPFVAHLSEAYSFTTIAFDEKIL